YYALLLTMFASFLFSAVPVRSNIGYCWRATREGEDASRALGGEAFRSKSLAGAISAGLTGIAGCWFGLVNRKLFSGSVLGMHMSINLIIAPIIGGLATLFGPVLGAFIIVPINEISRDLAQSFSINGLNLLIYGLLLMLVIKIAPQGCWPWLARHLGLTGTAAKSGIPE